MKLSYETCHGQGRYIAVAASLTGGNALATLVRMIQLWCMELGCNVPQVKIVTSDSVKIETTGENLEHCIVSRDEGD